MKQLHRSSRIIVLAAAGFALSAGLTACGSSSSSDTSLLTVERSIQFGDLDRAVYRLDRIEAESRLSNAGRLQAQLLRAEIAIAADQPEDAVDLVEDALEFDELAAPAHELRGKAYIRMGRFTEAARDLALAERQYDELGDTIRARDLKALATGLDSYSNGDFAGARTAWGGIESERLRNQIDLLSDSTLASQRGR
ncbi:MAG: hypothetical protein AAGI17_07155 [Planctomycetota bacterium]